MMLRTKRTRGKGAYHRKIEAEKYEALHKLVEEAKDGISRIDLHRKSATTSDPPISRQIVKKHVEAMPDIIEKDGLIYTKANYEAALSRMRELVQTLLDRISHLEKLSMVRRGDIITLEGNGYFISIDTARELRKARST